MDRMKRNLACLLMAAVVLVLPSGCATFSQATGCSEEVGVSIFAKILQFGAGAVLLAAVGLTDPGIAVTMAPHVLSDTTLHQGIFCLGQGLREL
jgi:hypothetical protein